MVILLVILIFYLMFPKWFVLSLSFNLTFFFLCSFCFFTHAVTQNVESVRCEHRRNKSGTFVPVNHTYKVHAVFQMLIIGSLYRQRMHHIESLLPHSSMKPLQWQILVWSMQSPWQYHPSTYKRFAINVTDRTENMN